MIKLFHYVTLRHRRLNYGLVAGRVVMVFGGKAPADSLRVDRLNAVASDPEGVTADRRTLNVGALGIALTIHHIAAAPSYRESPRKLHDRVFRLFAGSSLAPAMIRATIRTLCCYPAVGGDTQYYMDHAHRQIQPWSDGAIDVSVTHGID